LVILSDGVKHDAFDLAARILRTWEHEVPSVEVALIDRPTLAPLGAGEASTAPVAAALGNAVFDATGVRLRRVPLKLERGQV